jgi:hypothetical protein
MRNSIGACRLGLLGGAEPELSRNIARSVHRIDRERPLDLFEMEEAFGLFALQPVECHIQPRDMNIGKWNKWVRGKAEKGLVTRQDEFRSRRSPVPEDVRQDDDFDSRYRSRNRRPPLPQSLRHVRNPVVVSDGTRAQWMVAIPLWVVFMRVLVELESIPALFFGFLPALFASLAITRFAWLRMPVGLRHAGRWVAGKTFIWAPLMLLGMCAPMGVDLDGTSQSINRSAQPPEVSSKPRQRSAVVDDTWFTPERPNEEVRKFRKDHEAYFLWLDQGLSAGLLPSVLWVSLLDLRIDRQVAERFLAGRGETIGHDERSTRDLHRSLISLRPKLAKAAKTHRSALIQNVKGCDLASKRRAAIGALALLSPTDEALSALVERLEGPDLEPALDALTGVPVHRIGHPRATGLDGEGIGSAELVPCPAPS